MKVKNYSLDFENIYEPLGILYIDCRPVAK